MSTGTEYDDQAAERGTKVSDLYTGDMVFTPALRWETVTRVEADATSRIHVRVFTDRTGAGYSWRWWTLDRVRCVSRWDLDKAAAVRVQDWSHGRSGHITAGVSAYHRTYDAGNMLVTAEYNGPGEGWSVIDHPGGGSAVVTRTESKPKALALLNRAAKAHAKALGLPFVGLAKTGGAA